MEDLVDKKISRIFSSFYTIIQGSLNMKFQQIIFAHIRIIQILISLKLTLLNIIPKSLVTLQVLKFWIVQIKAYIRGFQMRY